MPVLAITKPDLDPLALALAMNHDRSNRQLQKDVKANLVQAEGLIQPRAVYEFLPVSGRGADWIVVASQGGDPVRLTIGPRVDLLAQSEQVLVGITTIGPALEREVEHRSLQGDYYGGYVLDAIGIALLGEAGKALDRLAEQSAAKRGWGVSYRLAPGSLDGWVIADQKCLVSLVATEQIEVSLNQSGVLWPFKSAASLVGLGPGYPTGEVKQPCRWCGNRKDCWTKERSFAVQRGS